MTAAANWFHRRRYDSTFRLVDGPWHLTARSTRADPFNTWAVCGVDGHRAPGRRQLPAGVLPSDGKICPACKRAAVKEKP